MLTHSEVGSARLSNATFEVPVRLMERAGIARVKEPVTIGLPFPKGACVDSDGLWICNDLGERLPLQATTLARWSDGSLKWVLLDFQADVGPQKEVWFRLGNNADMTVAPEFHAISISHSGGQLVVDTGPARFLVSQTLFKPFDHVFFNGIEMCRTQGSVLVLTDETGQEHIPYIDDLVVETHGPLRATVRATGKLRRADGGALADFVARMTWFAGHCEARLDWTIRNSLAAQHPRGLWDLGDPNSVYFKDCNLRLAMTADAMNAVEWNVDPREPLQSQRCQSFVLYQDSSGGEQWCSPNHVNRIGIITTVFRGYRVMVDGVVVKEGHRASPTIRLRAGGASLTATIPAFWQNFPKAFEVQGTTLCVSMFPRQCGDVFELQPGEQKTHTVFLQWTSDGSPSLAWTHAPLIAAATPDWYESTRAIAHLGARLPVSLMSEEERWVERTVDVAVEGEQSFFHRRERIDEYGWRHFGDLYADHEAVHSPPDRPLIAHYNNQYDALYGALVQFARSGNPRWFDLVRDLARHVIDIDLYHTAEDRPALNGGLFWHTDHYTDAGTATHRSFSVTSPQAKASPTYGGGPACEHNYASGLLHYYYFTGDPDAREAVVSLADWVIRMDDGRSRFMGWLDRRPTGYCSVTATPGYHGPGRGSGNSISVLLDGWILTGHRAYLDKAESLIRRCIHPQEKIHLLRLDDIEYRWSYTVFLQAIGKYLDLKAECGELDEMYAYARSSLLHFAAWMAEHEVPYKDVLDRVLIPTETWPAQDFRKANVFCIAVKYASAEQRKVFLEKADFFFERAAGDLRSFETHTLTRPLVLLMTNAYVYSYCRRHPEDVAPAPKAECHWGAPRPFKPQFHELYRLRNWLQRVGRLMTVMVRGGTARERKHP